MLHLTLIALGRFADWITHRILDSAERMPPELMRQFRSHQLRAILSLTPIMMIANIVNGTAFAVLEVNQNRMSHTDWAWLTFVYYLAFTTLRDGLKRRDHSLGTGTRTIGKLILGSILLGLVWSYPLTIVASGNFDNDELAFVAALTAGMIAGGSVALYPVPLAAIAYVGIISTIALLAIFAGIPHLAVPYSMITAMFFLIVVASLVRHHAIFLREFRRRSLAETQSEVLNLLIGNDHCRPDSCIWQADHHMNLLTSAIPIHKILNAVGSAGTNNLLEILHASGASISDDPPRNSLVALTDWLSGNSDENNFEVRLSTNSTPKRTLVLAARRIEQSASQAIFYNGYIRDITDEAHAKAEIHRLATHDDLTGLPNHVEFLRRASQALNDLSANARPFFSCLMFIDADNLKWINDEFGHRSGDILLKNISDTLRQFTGQSQVLCRKGGDEFLVFSLFKSERALFHASSELSRKLNGEFDCDGRKLQRRCTVGVAYCAGTERDVATLEAEADTALKAQKKHAKSQIGFYTPEIAASHKRDSVLIRDIRKAIFSKELYLEFQPIVSSDGQTTIAAEALLRWCHPELGFIPPVQIVDIAAAEGLGDTLTEYVISSGMKQSLCWPQGVSLSVNVSAGQFAIPDFWKRVVSFARTLKFRADRLWIEVTERELFPDSEVARKNFVGLQQAGVRLALDDFGTGYSSLHALDAVDWDIIKVDRSITHGCYRRPASLTMIRAVCEIAAQSGRDVVIEGIEEERDYKALKSAGPAMFQGFLFHKPARDPVLKRDNRQFCSTTGSLALTGSVVS